MAVGQRDRLVESGLRVVRSVVGTESRLEQALIGAHNARMRRSVKKDDRGDVLEYRGHDFVYLSSKLRPGPRVGVFMKGGCDLASVFVATPRLRATVSGTWCIYNQGLGISDSRPDVLLQSLEPPPKSALVDVVAAPRRLPGRRAPSGLSLPAEYFAPRLFEPTFAVPRRPRLGVFPKSVVILSVGPSYARTVYRHRQHGYLVDPGGWWLNQSMDKVLANRERAAWFKREFESVGKLTVDSFADLFGTVVSLVKERTGADVIVFNTLVVDPGTRVHNYRLRKNAQSVRRRDFDLALRDLSARLDFHILDVDRALKAAGVTDQLDYAHFPADKMEPLATEAYRIFTDLGLVS